MLCGNCFHDVPDEARFCPYCGCSFEVGHPDALAVGSILNGRYLVGRVLGQGGFGITYKAIDHATGDVVAIKEYFPDTLCRRAPSLPSISVRNSGDDDFSWGMSRFLDEAETLAGLGDVPGVVHVHEYFEENGTAYFSMDFVDGTDLRHYLSDHGDRLRWLQLRDIVYPVMDALERVHAKGIIHRDISPDNIYVKSDGRPVLLDFGAARMSLGDRNRSLSVVLKNGYAPKEQYFSRGRQGPWTDVYALGATIYRCLTGEVPPESLERSEAVAQGEPDPLRPIRDFLAVRPEMEAVVLQAMAIEPDRRFQTMTAFAAALRLADEGGGHGPKPEPTPAPTPDPKPDPTPGPTPEPGPKPEPTPGPGPKPGPDPSPGPTPTGPEPGPTSEPKPEPEKKEKGTPRKLLYGLVAVVAVMAVMVGFYSNSSTYGPTPTYTILFAGNGSTSGTMSSQEVEEDSTFTVPDSGFSRYGYTFAGWSRSTTGSAAYQAGDEVQATGAMTLYAVWEPDFDESSLTVTPDDVWETADGGTAHGFIITNDSAYTLSYTVTFADGSGRSFTAGPGGERFAWSTSASYEIDDIDATEEVPADEAFSWTESSYTGDDLTIRVTNNSSDTRDCDVAYVVLESEIVSYSSSFSQYSMRSVDDLPPGASTNVTFDQASADHIPYHIYLD